VGTALAVGLAGGIVLTAVTGARRTVTAFPRFLDASRAEDVYLAGASPTDPRAASLIHDLERLPQVEVAASVGAMLVIPPNPNLLSAYHFAGLDRRYGNEIDVPNVVAGRRPHPDRADELLINRAMAKARHLRVGSTITWRAVVPDPNTGDVDPSTGTPVRLHVVGIGVYPNEVVPTAQYDAVPFLYLTTAFYRAHPTAMQSYGFEVIRLKRGHADVDGYRTGLNAVFRRHGVSPQEFLFSDRLERNTQVRRAIEPQAVALALFALVAAIAFVLVIGQVLTRQVFLDSTDYPALRALGMSRTQLAATAMVKVLAVSIAGAALAVLLAILASPLTPVGPARLAEPHPGIAVNVAVLGLGFAGVVTLLALTTLLPAWRAAGAGSATRQGGESRAGHQRIAFAVPSPTLALGVRYALQPGRGRTAVPVRSALVSTGLAVATTVGAFVFTTNLDRLVHTPRLYGWDWDLRAGDGFFPVDVPTTMKRLGTEPSVEAVAGANYGQMSIAGRPVAAVGIDAIRGVVFPTLLEGRRPRTASEVVLGSRTLARSHAHVGDVIDVQVGDSAHRKVRVVGRAVFPKLGAGSFSPTNLGEGVAANAALFADPSTPDQRYTVVLIRLRPGADVDAVRARLNPKLRNLDFCGGDPGCVAGADRPGDISNATRVRGTSFALAAVLLLMAVAALAHVLVTFVRRRRRDLAVLKTLSFVRGQISAVTAWQATTVALVALLIGVPGGLALGRYGWWLFAKELGIDPASTTPIAALLVAVPATVVVANLIAAVPAALAARTRPAVVLRSE
jgi:ABC-type lipoprotein release transport system permease subunit